MKKKTATKWWLTTDDLCAVNNFQDYFLFLKLFVRFTLYMSMKSDLHDLRKSLTYSVFSLTADVDAVVTVTFNTE